MVDVGDGTFQQGVVVVIECAFYVGILFHIKEFYSGKKASKPVSLFPTFPVQRLNTISYLP